MNLNVIHNADNMEILRNISENSIDAIVTDSPYGLKFMNKHWDADVPKTEIWQECLRVLKPGGHLLSFFGTRTYHRGVVRIEDVGFEIRDMIQWVYGSGFPKSMNVGKAVDKKRGNEREVIGSKLSDDIRGGNFINQENKKTITQISRGFSEYEGWGTGLKPAAEPIVMARKPISEKTTLANILKWGVGGLNIDGCRIGLNGEKRPGGSAKRVFKNNEYTEEKIYGDNKTTPESGRWPANFIHDGSEEVLTLFPMTSSGVMKKGQKRIMSESGRQNTYGYFKPDTVENDTFGDSGSAARFFYCAKASTSERNAGLSGAGKQKDETRNEDFNTIQSRLHGSVARLNNHPTVKPIALIRYLVRLITPKGGIVLDPYAGSGTTGIACELEGFKYILIEKEKDYCDIAEKRIKHYEAGFSHG